MKKILIIGGAGYIGSSLVNQLISSGRQVTVLGRSDFPKFGLTEGVSYISGDFGNLDLIRKLLSEHQEVIHLAFASLPNTNYENPLVDLLQNLPPSIQLFSEAAANGNKLILVSSGGTVYGEAQELPICESHLTNPISSYGITKLTLERCAYLYAFTKGLKLICVRPSNAYGIGQRPFLGQGFIATAIASAIKGIPIKIFGKYGSVRDYIYVSDLASGIISALDYGRLFETYNVSSGIGYNNLEVLNFISTILDEFGIKISTTNLDSRPFDVKTNILTSNKLTLDTGWHPKVEFYEGLVATCEWNMKQSLC